VLAVLVGGNVDRAGLDEPGRLAGFPLQLPVQFVTVSRHPDHFGRPPESDHQSGGSPSGSTGQVSALEQDHILDAQLGQMIGGSTAYDSAADDDYAGMAWKLFCHFNLLFDGLKTSPVFFIV
jgi:hypothetical protein